MSPDDTLTDVLAAVRPPAVDLIVDGHDDQTLRGAAAEAILRLTDSAGYADDEAAEPLLMSVRGERAEEINFVGLTASAQAWFADHLAPDAGERFRRVLTRALGVAELPVDAAGQLALAVRRAGGASVTITSMFIARAGRGDGDGDGVAYSHNPGDGTAGLTGVFHTAGQHGTRDIALADIDEPWLQDLRAAVAVLEDQAGDAVEADFVVRRHRLWITSTRPATRSPLSACVIAADLARVGVLGAGEVLHRVAAEDFAKAFLRHDEGLPAEATIGHGIGVSPGMAAGRMALSASAVLAWAEAGEPSVLFREETRPEDLPALLAAAAVVTTRGGYTSHAAVVTRTIGRPCVAALGSAEIDDALGLVRINDRSIAEGDLITVDGGTGRIGLGNLTADVSAEADGARAVVMSTLLRAADDARRMDVWANADTEVDAIAARQNGATGIGLCRTEHMFLGPRARLLEDVLLNVYDTNAQESLAELRRLQRDDFARLLTAMDGLPVTIRLLDPPRHEFLPDVAELSVQTAVAQALGDPAEHLSRRLRAVRRLAERNPMLGTRGVRLGLLLPALYEMQVSALLEATAGRIRSGGSPRPRIMVPMVAAAEETRPIHQFVSDQLAYWQPLVDTEMSLPFGVMIETPRAALIAADLASQVDFFSYGTNDLTQLTWGLSRDDADAALLPLYLRSGIVDESPFATLDLVAVGRLIEQSLAAARGVNPGLSIGACGEHAGDPASIDFFHRAGFSYISCAPPRVPIARYAAGRAAAGEFKAGR